MSETVLSFEDALNCVLAQAHGLQLPDRVKAVALLECAGRVLAEPVVTSRDQPPFDRATRDGYAVRAADIAKKRTLQVIGTIAAGKRWSGAPVSKGDAVEIMTGAPLPAGADAVLMLEHAQINGKDLHVAEGRTLRVGENVVARGSEAKRGAELLPVGCVMRAAEVAVAASCGSVDVSVFVKPRVAIVATGDELVGPGQQPEHAQIRDTNSYALASLVQTEGGKTVRLSIARDTLGKLRSRIEDSRDVDLLLISGGVSAGKFDLVEQVLLEFGAEFFFTGAMIQPGRPIVFGRMPRGKEWTYFFGLPGNPVSTQVCFQLFVAPLLRAFAGCTDIAPQFVEATLAADVKGGAKVTRFLPAELTGAWDGVSVQVVAWQGSGDIAANARGNGYVVLPAGVDSFRKGETVRVLLR